MALLGGYSIREAAALKQREETLMKVDLPTRFIDKMKQLLGEEFDEFMASYEAPRAFGLRLNPLKVTKEEWRELNYLQNPDRRIPWTENGFYYKEEERPGKHPFYHAGLYYIQEPSAMLPAELLDVKPGHRVLDLCAAPGGKSTQIAGMLKGSGILVANDNASERTKALAKNIELAGIRNAIVLNEEPAAIAKSFPEWFHRILVDAPCSGEGMFRKADSMVGDWEKHSVQKCSAMQRDIMNHAAKMLAPGGLLLYSTCTFSPEENESQIASFLEEHPDFVVEPIQHECGLRAGRPDWVDEATAASAGPTIVSSLSGTARLWPHVIEGEGHYAALLRKKWGSGATEIELERPKVSTTAIAAAATPALAGKMKEQRLRKDGKGKGAKSGSSASDQTPVELWEAFCKQQLILREGDWSSVTFSYGERLYMQPAGVPSLDGLKVVRAGWYVGEVKWNRFVPSQALAMRLHRDEASLVLELDGLDGDEVIRYLRGETLFVAEDRIIKGAGDKKIKGFVLVCLAGRPIGWGKYENGVLKNELSPGWRRT